MLKDSVLWVRCRRTLLVASILATSVMGSLSPLFAIPAWSRKYDVPCSMCHYPTPPRLNAFGHRFRRAQFRTEEDLGKDPDWKKLEDYVAMRIRGRYQYSSAENPTGSHTVTSTFALNDATLFYAGPVTKHFSGFVELERPGNEEIIEAVVSAGGIYGSYDDLWTFRLGQFHTLTRVGYGGLDRPTGLSTPDALTRDLSAGRTGFSGGTAFKLNQDQVGVEGTYVSKNWRVIAQILNGPDAIDSATTDRADDNQDKDVLLAYEMMWGELASGLTAFGYRGIQDDPDLVGPIDDRIRFYRYGITAAHQWKFGLELQGGFVWAKDTFEDESPTQEDITGRGFWGELEYYAANLHDLTLFARWDQTDPNTDVSDNARKKVTLGVCWPVGGWHARWGLELRRTTQETPGGDLSTQEAVGELMLNF